ncbi:MAG: tRNA (guanosine(46)-N7)-methyltransferase TrmB [Caulobacterales bacterium]|nr:tRNA (guanosine(46)-N7)-methyltransferase TrmB [Caulobacterales bacterium]
MSDDRADSGSRRLYGRGAGRPLSARRRRLAEALLPKLALPAGPLDPAALFPCASEARLEIGFGGGEHLIAQAARAPAAGFIGAEPFLEGVGKALAGIEESGLANIRLHHGDARDVLDRLAPAALSTVYLLFPDPWPKRRHWKRRFLQPGGVEALARVLRPGGRLRVATDVKSYVAWTLEQVRAHPAFAWTARRPADWRDPPAGHVTTRYEAKNIGDCAPVYLDFDRA